MRLLLDVGNTRLKWAFLERGVTGQYAALVHKRHELAALLSKRWRFEVRPEAVIVCSVASAAVNALITQWCVTNWSITPQFLTAPVHGGGVTNAYKTPAQLGVDRWCALIAARQLSQAPVCVIDCGTAITVDVMDADGQHQGGWIVPGISLMTQSLAVETANIDAPVQPIMAAATQCWGDDTASGITLGIQHMLMTFINTAFTRFAEEMGPAASYFLTGGDAPMWADKLSVQARHEPHLVLKGVATWSLTTQGVDKP